MASYFVWKSEYMLDIKEIDDQHKYFVSLLNKIYNSVLNCDEDNKLRQLLNDLIAYMIKHFETEEKYFDAFHYSGSAEHKEQHRLLKEKVLAFKNKFDNHEEIISFELVDFLENWLVDHMHNMDSKYVECFHEHGLK